VSETVDPIARLRSENVLSALDAEMAREMSSLAGDGRVEIRLALALSSRETREGHVCADLARLAGTVARGLDGTPTGVVYPSLEEFRAALSTSPLVGTGAGNTPLVLDAKDRLYLRRYWEDERTLASAIRARTARTLPANDPAGLRSLVLRLFGPMRRGAPDWQRIAAQIACVSPLTIVTGGPGTGKTTTVTKILALAILDCLAGGRKRPRAVLLAPTGKAAARLAEATANAARALDCPEEVLPFLPTVAETVHRALGAGGAGRFRLGAERPLLADVVVVDEASMIDVSMMRRLVDAVPEHARLVLLGDRHQLSSVEAGAVLADLCGDTAAPRYSSALAANIAEVFGEELPADALSSSERSIDDSVVTLTKSHRFSETSVVGGLAVAIQRGDADAVLASFSGASGDAVLLEPPSPNTPHADLPDVVLAGFSALAASGSPEVALERLGGFRVLSAHRTGPLGVVDMNRWIEALLVDARLIRADAGLVRPLMVTRNDANLELWNGDVGVLFRDPQRTSAGRAHFVGPDGRARALSPARLPVHEPAFAMSVHKSQGSEFDEVLVVLPPPGSPLLSRELLYTAVTRARRRVVVHATEEAVREAVRNRVARASGLADALRGA
jgi:exodeoxyribonuclease V alpha subunit